MPWPLMQMMKKKNSILNSTKSYHLFPKKIREFFLTISMLEWAGALRYGSLGNKGIGKVNSNGILCLNKCSEHDLITNSSFHQSNKWKASVDIHLLRTLAPHWLHHSACLELSWHSYHKSYGQHRWLLDGSSFDTLCHARSYYPKMMKTRNKQGRSTMSRASKSSSPAVPQ